MPPLRPARVPEKRVLLSSRLKTTFKWLQMLLFYNITITWIYNKWLNNFRVQTPYTQILSDNSSLPPSLLPLPSWKLIIRNQQDISNMKARKSDSGDWWLNLLFSVPGELHQVQRLTAGGDANRLLQPLVPTGRQTEGHHHHRALGGSHQQTWADQAIHLPGETLTEVKGGDGLSRFSVNAGHTWTTWAGEWVILGIWTAGVITKMREWGNVLCEMKRVGALKRTSSHKLEN